MENHNNSFKHPVVLAAIATAISVIIVALIQSKSNSENTTNHVRDTHTIIKSIDNPPGKAAGTAQKVSEPTILKSPFYVDQYYKPSGWMGDGEMGKKYTQLDVASREAPRLGDNDGITYKISYKPGPKKWAGIYWLYPGGNWGDVPGKKIENTSKITFWAKGTTGTELLVFMAGGVNDKNKPYHDSFEKRTPNITLTKDWRLFTINVKDEDLSNTIAAFGWVAQSDANPNGVKFFLDGIQYQ